MTTANAAEQAADLTVLPDSAVPAAFDRGHLYSPDMGYMQYALDGRYIYDYRPGNDFEPMPEAPHGGKAFAWWWNNAARIDVPDYLGLRVGDEITIQHVTSTGPGTVIETHRFGAVVRYPMPEGADKSHDEMYVCRRNTSGHWYR